MTSENHTLQFKNNQEKVRFSVPARIIHSLKKEFNIQDDREVKDFIISLIEKGIPDRTAESNSGAFSETETKEIEDNLKGVGYISTSSSHMPPRFPPRHESVGKPEPTRSTLKVVNKTLKRQQE